MTALCATLNILTPFGCPTTSSVTAVAVSKAPVANVAAWTAATLRFVSASASLVATSIAALEAMKEPAKREMTFAPLLPALELWEHGLVEGVGVAEHGCPVSGQHHNGCFVERVERHDGGVVCCGEVAEDPRVPG